MKTPWFYFSQPLSRFYQNGRATELGRTLSRLWALWARLGLPPRRLVGLDVIGRKTGRIHPLALVVAELGGERYLVSMLGECEWVKNVRAAGFAWLVGWRRKKVRLEEVPVERRAPIIQAYLRVAPGGRPHIGLGAQASLAECTRVAPRHPVFRIAPDPGARTAGHDSAAP